MADYLCGGRRPERNGSVMRFPDKIFLRFDRENTGDNDSEIYCRTVDMMYKVILAELVIEKI
jgi:hypothetical protein